MRLGIDIGTTKCAAVVVDASGALRDAASTAHGADVPLDGLRAEQSPDALLAATEECVRRLDPTCRNEVRSIGVTGQMHGVVLLDAQGGALGNLVTWQDPRCEPTMLERWRDRVGRELRTGYGCATLAWLAENDALPNDAAAASTIHDLLVRRWTDGDASLTDPTDAASWGLFSPAEGDWDFDAAMQLGIPPHLLPTVHPSRSLAGTLRGKTASALGLPVGAPIMVATGDNQASLFATLDEPARQIALTLGTGGQMSVVVDESLRGRAPASERFEYRPYFDGASIAAASSLCGGSAWFWLGQAASRWMSDLGCDAPDPRAVCDRLNDLGRAACECPTIRPHFLGQRYAPTLLASIERITMSNFTLGQVARGLAVGIMRQFQEMMPAELLESRDEIVASGNAFRKNPLLRDAAEEVFARPLRLGETREEAATGAAMLSATP